MLASDSSESMVVPDKNAYSWPTHPDLAVNLGFGVCTHYGLFLDVPLKPHVLVSEFCRGDWIMGGDTHALIGP